jgi:hypothetical protein
LGGGLERRKNLFLVAWLRVADIVFQIEELKASISDEDVNDDQNNHGSPSDGIIEQEPAITAGLLMGNPSNVTREYLIQCIPPRDVSERALWHWFNSSNPELRKHM